MAKAKKRDSDVKAGYDAVEADTLAKSKKPTKPPDTPPPQLNDPRRLAVDGMFEQDASLREAVVANLKNLRPESKAVAIRAQAAFAAFNPITLSTEELERRNHVPHGDDVVAMQLSVIEKGVEAIRASKVQPSITLHNSGDLKALIKKKRGDDPSLVGTIGLEPLFNYVVQRPEPNPSPVYTQCKAELEAQRILDQVEGVPGKKKDEEERKKDSTLVERGAEQLVKETVNLQMETATSPETSLQYHVPSRANQAALQSNIDTFQLRAGASDVTSYHDFNNLQIAFEHVWTKIFDGQLNSLGQELYHEYVKLKDFTGNTDPDLTVSTLDDLSRLMAEIRRLSQIVQDDTPSQIRGDDGSATGTQSGQSDNSGDWAKAGLGVATGGVSWLVELAINEFSKWGQKPLIRWEDFPGPLPGRADLIDVTTTDNAVAQGLVEIVLNTDAGSHLKIIEFQTVDPDTKQVLHGPSISNAGNVPSVTLAISASRVTAGLLLFGAEDTPGNNNGRYVLGRLIEKLKDRTRVTFHWRG